MTTLQEALQQAAEYVDAVPDDRGNASHIDREKLVEALKTALVQQGRPEYWEWRVLDTHPQTVTYGQWSAWKRVEPRNPNINTVQDSLEEIQSYIAKGHKYELRALYTAAPAPPPALGDPAGCRLINGVWHGVAAPAPRPLTDAEYQRMTANGAKAWDGVDPQELRTGMKPLTNDAATAIVQGIVSDSGRPIGIVAFGLLVARAIESAHGIGCAA